MVKESLATVLEEEEEDVEQDQYLVFVAGSQEYGIQAMRIQEISAMVEIAKVPRAPAHIEGILNLRGRLVSVLDFRKRLGFEPKKHDEDTRVIIVEHGDHPIGVVVDSVEEVIRIPNEKVQKLPEATVSAAPEEFMTGVGMLDSRLVILLDADKLLTKTELKEVDAMKIAD